MTKDNDTQEEQAADNSREGVQPTQPKVTIDANNAAKELREQNDRKEKLLAREEELEAKRALGGQSEAGAVPPKPVEETPQEYSKRVMSGSL